MGSFRPPHPVPLRRRLLAIALASIAPLAVTAGFALSQITQHQTEQARERSLEATRMAANAIELELGRSLNVLQALAESTLLDNGDIAHYESQLRRVLPLVPDWRAVIVNTPDGRVIAHVPHEAPEGLGRMPEAQSFELLLQSQLPVIGQLARGPGGRWGVPLHAPVLRDGRLKLVITAVLEPEAVLQAITMRGQPPGWMTTVLDANGIRVARTGGHSATLGGPASPSLASLLAENPFPEGTGLTETLEGESMHTAFVRLPEAGWAVVTGIPTAEVEESARQAFITYGGGLLLSLLLALSAALFAARRINRPMRQLTRAARAIGQKQVPQPPVSDIVEVQEVGNALVAAAEARQHSEHERDALLTRLQATRLELKEQVDDLQLLQTLSQRLLQLPTLREQLGALLEALCNFHHASHGTVTLSFDGGPLELHASRGYADDAFADFGPEVVPSGTTSRSMRSGGRIVIRDVETDPDFAPFLALARRVGFRAVHTTPVLDPNGAVMGSISVQIVSPREPSMREVRMADLCAGMASVFIERARAQEEAGRSAQRLRVALDSSTMPFVILQPIRAGDGQLVDFRMEFVNEAGAHALGRSVGELLGEPLRNIVAGWERDAVFACCVEVVERRETQELEWQAQRHSCECWFHIVVNPFQSGVALWFANITQRKEQERQLLEADRRKDAFLATLAHELRNPLAPIRQAAALVGSPGASEAQKRWSQEVIERQVRHMALLLDDLLDVSRITHDKIVLRRQPVPLADAIEGAMQTTRTLLDAKGHRLYYRPPTRSLQLDADPLRVEQIITNLLTNAAKYTPDGGEISIEVAFERNQAHVTVADNGIGIAPENLESVFSMFAQIPSPDGQAASGLGIGLALARGLARLHGGDLRVSSEGLGHGSRFTVTLPLAKRLAVPRSEPAAPTLRHVRRKVLVADDNHDIAETMAELLRMEGHEVCTAFDGRQALDAYQRFRPDVALLDIGMPGLRGDEVAAAIRSLPGGHDVLLVAFTGWGQALDRERALSSGFDRHLTKPANIDEVYALIAEAPDRMPDSA
ncbi:ATP-binding protein [Stutzerimonas azotifigens]|uniref:ATP-binding protein n=1 Tax=Stutzerimonas azotifigens TaxID=291995 RepID=UPI00137891FC|nr:ATP-binding protein [Stutzerimonas azotifigens]